MEFFGNKTINPEINIREMGGGGGGGTKMQLEKLKSQKMGCQNRNLISYGIKGK